MEELTQLESVERVLRESEETAVFVYKHSTACPVSAEALRVVKSFLADAPTDSPPVYFVKVIESRPVSNAIAEAVAVPHKSPQLLLLRERKAVWDASHFAITEDAIRNAWKQDVG